MCPEPPRRSDGCLRKHRYAAHVTEGPVRRLVSGPRLQVWRDFLRAHALVVGTLEAELEAERNLPLTWYDVLVNLVDAPGQRLRMQELAGRVLFSRSGLTRLVDRMAAAGLVRRERCPEDRRGTFAVLTESGRRCLREATGVHLRGVDAHFTGVLDDTDVEALRRTLAKVLAVNERSGDREPGRLGPP